MGWYILFGSSFSYQISACKPYFSLHFPNLFHILSLNPLSVEQKFQVLESMITGAINEVYLTLKISLPLDLLFQLNKDIRKNFLFEENKYKDIKDFRQQ